MTETNEFQIGIGKGVATAATSLLSAGLCLAGIE